MDKNSLDLDLEDGIAVIGMHCLFPGASSADQFWKRLCEGYEAVEDISDEALTERGVSRKLLSNKQYVKASIPLAGVDEFDYAFFGVSPKEAAVMDPQHRKFLECSWAALENSGHKPTDVAGAIGMFAGSGMQWYLIRNVLTHMQMVDDMGEFLVRHTANDKDFLATRASFSMNVHGPSINVQTACSTSLVAVHLAMQSLLNNECDIVIAGGSTIEIPNGVGYLYREEEVRSADGRCRAFDKDSNGTVFGSGAGAVVLRRLEDAIADGDSIQAVLLGSAVNNDGSEKAGYMAPSVDYQARAIAEAVAVAGVDPELIGYFETHGTGTKIGDPIEVAALTQAFGNTSKNQFCGLGSVKTNIGHLDTAAGIASLIKVVQCLKHGILPASLNYKEANPEIDFENTPFYVNHSKQDWPADMSPRIAGVSSLGVGGTNAHIIACEPPDSEPSSPAGGKHILPLAAKTRTSLQGSVENLREYLRRNSDVNIADVAFTLQEGRVDFAHRAAVVCNNASHAAECLQDPTVATGTIAAADPELVFMFPGQGAQYAGMAAGLYKEYSGFRDTVDECLAILRSKDGPDLTKVLFVQRGDEVASEILEDTSVTQPALFVIEFALAQLLISWGLQPSSMIGHSLGEYVAAALAGVFTLEQALELLTIRGKLIAQLPAGRMIAIPASAQTLEQYVDIGIDVAAINGQDLTTLSGPTESIEKVLEQLVNAGIGGQLLKTSHAFHSTMLEPILSEFETVVERLRPRAPDIPFVSNVSGTWISDEQAQSPGYWASHMRLTVDFLGGIQAIVEKGDCLFLEVGPGNTLTTLASGAVSQSNANSAISCLPHAKDPTDDVASLLSARGSLWANGIETDWSTIRKTGRRHRLQLPTYVFEKHRCWLEPVAPTVDSAPDYERLSLSRWGSVANWRQQLPPADNHDATYEHVLLFANDDDLGKSLARHIRKCSDHVTMIHPGIELEKTGDDTFCLAPDSLAQHVELIRSLGERGSSAIIHAWNLDEGKTEARQFPTTEDVDTALQTGFYCLMNLAKAIQNTGTENDTRVFVVASDVFSVHGEATQPINATLLGPVRVIPAEIPEIRIQLVDYHSSDVASDPEKVVAKILLEFKAETADNEIAYRGGKRFRQCFDPVTLPAADANRIPLQRNGVYLITGGFGGLGRALAERLAEDFQARIVLVSRPRTGNQASSPDEHSREHFIRSLEQHGSEIHRIEADITSSSELSDSFDILEQRFGGIDGVFHAAGRLDDSLISIKDNQTAEAVLLPKVQGTIVLEQMLERFAPQFQVYFSSVSALAGLPGQIDYAAANAFLDAFALNRDQRHSCKYLSIAWSSWANIGMASRAITEARLPRSLRQDLETMSHSLYSHIRPRSNGVDFFGEISTTKLWSLNEHRLQTNQALLPGTAYIDLIVSAFSSWHGPAPVQIENLVFAVPLQMDDGESRILHLDFDAAVEDSFEIVVSSWSQPGEDPLEHVRATVRALTALDRPEASDARFDESVPDAEPRTISNPLLKFGARWHCLDRKVVSKDRATLNLRLVDDLCPDLSNNPLHPAMMDLAIGGAPELFTAPEDSATGLVPFKVRSIRVWEPLQSRITSHVTRVTPNGDDAPESNVRIESVTGNVLVEIDGFCMRKLDADKLGTIPSLTVPEHNRVENKVTEGISAAEGFEVITRLLATDSPANVTIAPQKLDVLLRELRLQFQGEEETDAVAADVAALLPRPALNTAYEAADSEQERAIAAIWQIALGIENIGMADNFYELGGHSLLLTQIVAKIRREYKWSLPLEKVFDQLTIREWAQLANDPTVKSTAAMSSISRVDRSALRRDSAVLGRLH